jgi:hypothetical protein
VTSAQRARLVVALGVLNLVLASLALAVGISAPTQPIPGVAAAPSSTPAGPVSLPPVETPPPVRTPSPGPTESAPPAPPPSATPEATPTTEPSVTPVPIGVVIVANRPPATPDPTTPAATPDPTARPNPTDPPKPPPSTKPPKPSPTPKPAVKPQAHPPCPGSVDGPPGHSKGQPWEKPCGKGNGGDKGNGNTKGGVIIVLPLALSAAAPGGRRRIAETLRRRPSAR